MALTELIDTNIFLEILLSQRRAKDSKIFLNQNTSSLAISDFSLHSIGVILYRQKKYSLFTSFWNDLENKIKLLSLPVAKYFTIEKISVKYALDFDDSYQLSVAQEYGIILATLDKDFESVPAEQIHFL
ncbi:MAG TPA: PIN domain-containing protein [Balneolaceae bacterium]|nr:PIN domain-containing protein [Balneolaceae bacterium]